MGVDTAENALAWAQTKHGSSRISFRPVEDLSASGSFDLCYTNGVFHHIPPEKRAEALQRIHQALVRGGHFALFENNPWNPGTRLVMRRIAFDRDAVTLSPVEAQRLLRRAGFHCAPTRSLFYFPRPLAWLRATEPWLARIPLGAQYCVLAIKR